MKERPILFSTSMVQAILDGRKTQTRRIIKKAPTTAINHRLIELDNGWNWQVNEQGVVPTMHREICNPMICPYGMVGDRLWVRETWHVEPGARGWSMDENEPCTGWIEYKAGGSKEVTAPDFDAVQRCFPKGEVDWDFVPSDWRPSIFMPRWACRIVLEISNIRIERLQAISDSDAKAEGILETMYGWKSQSDSYRYGETPRAAFHILWEEINGSDSLKANPWIWVVEFKLLEGGES
ncbi:MULTISPECIES: hypothetical protein [Acinetobacter]|uniref:Morphogenetic protein n=1 Tax=Acinetobacter higginsii TaxID=70347 RepID=N9T1S9_9GAMM|nr:MULTISPECIES: hypothetical protein [Acinetobacter]ENX57627.1 hypothetical protein F902_02024 [Acinetobacter higginsii]